MSITLSSLAARLTAQAPARNSVPADYSQLVKDAVWQLSQDAPLVRETTVSVVSGTASYALPSDFLFVIELESVLAPDGVIVSDAGLIPVSDSWEERWYVEGVNLVLVPTPAYTASRDLRYAAAHVLNQSNAYAYLSENGARVALLYAQHLVLAQQANAVAGDGWKYAIGDEEVDKSNQGRGLREQAQGALAQYQTAMRQFQAYAGTRARYNGHGLGSV